jgi:DHA1 family inner membrane transport protein
VLIVAIAALYLGDTSPAAVAIALLVWGLVGFGLVPSLQYRVVSLAGPGQDLAATLPASAVTAGIAVGALGGGSTVSAHGPAGAVLTGLVICAVALPLSWLTSFLKPPVTSVAPQPSEQTAADAAELLADI